jgi:hypothetical protein
MAQNMITLKPNAVFMALSEIVSRAEKSFNVLAFP